MALIQQITYNADPGNQYATGFSFPFNTLDVSSAVVYGDDGITVVGTQYIFNVAGVIQSSQSVSEPGYTGSNHETLSVDFLMRSMRDNLMQPGGRLTVIWGNTNANLSNGVTTPVVSINAAYADPTHFSVPYDIQPGGFISTGGTKASVNAFNVDIAWGPKPQDLKFVKFSGGNAAMYNWSVSALVKECFGSSCLLQNQETQGAKAGILSFTNRYQHSIDGDGLCTRSISGRLLVSSAAVANGKNADAYRYTLIPPIPLNFKRTSQSFNQSEDGRELTFTITDQEWIYTLPAPITDGQASFSMVLSEYGSRLEYTLSGWFSAARDTDKSIILSKIADLANAKFPIGQNLFFTSRTLTEDIYSKNRIDFQISAWTTDGVSADGSLSAGAYAVGLKTLTQSPPNTNGQSTIIYPTGGDVPTGGIWSPAPVPWDACNGGFVSASQPYGKGTITAANIFKAAPNTTITKGEGYYTQAQPSKVAPKLVEYKETISYEIDNKIAVFYPKAIGQAPVAQQTGNPVLNIIQAGYATTFGQSVADAPKPPAPFVGNGSKNFIVGAPMIQADSPQTVGDGTSNRYTIHWRYIIRHVGTPIESLDEINFRFPIDQQRPQIPADQYEVKGEFPENPIIQGGQLPQA